MNRNLWTGKFILSLSILFGISLVSNMVLSTLTVFAKNLTQVDTYAGLMTTIFTIAALSVRLFAGMLLDRFNCKKVVVTGLFLMLCSTILFLSCQDIYAALFFRGIQGVGFGISSTGASTYIVKNLDPKYILEGVGYSSISNGITAVIGPSLGYYLIGVRYDNFTNLFVAVSIMTSVLIGLMIVGKEPVTQINYKSHKIATVPIDMRCLAIPLVLLFLNALTQSGVVSFISLYAISLGFGSIGMFFSVNAVGIITSRFFMNRLVRKYGKFTMIALNSLVFSISIFFISRVQTNIQLIVLAFPAGFAMGSIAPIINTYIVESLPLEKMGLGNAMYYSGLDLGYGLGSFVLGIIALNYSYSHVFLTGAIIQLICCALALTYHYNAKKNYLTENISQ